MKILLIEDSETVADVITDVLNNAGFIEIEHVTNAEDGLSKIKKQMYHAIILDNGLPKMQGIDLLEQIPPFLRKRTLFFSGEPRAIEAAKKLSVGIAIDKTFGPSKLLTFLETL